VRDEQAGLTEWLRSEFTAEQNAGFPRLKCVPDTHVIRFLDHFDSLDRDGQSELVTILVDWSSHNLLGTLPNPCYEQFSKATTFPGLKGGLRYTGVNLLAGLAKGTSGEALSGFFQSQGVTGLAMEPPAELVRDSSDLVPVSIPYLRRLVHTTLADLFATQTTDIGSEMWRYEGRLEGVEVKLDIQFSGRMGRPQLSYNAAVQGMGRSFVSPNLCFESTLGVGFGRWDYITKENAVRSVALLAELIRWLAQLPERLPPGCGQANDDSPR
jgi:hypothetical protein